MGNYSYYSQSVEPDEFRPFLVRRKMSDIPDGEIEWVWPNRILAGALNLLVGVPEQGKSFVSLDVAAGLSRGKPWPDQPGVPVQPGTTVILSAEDDPSRTIRKRLDKANADLDRIFLIETAQRGQADEPAHINLDIDLRLFENCITDVGAKLAILDPITAYLGGRDSHNNSDIRNILTPLCHMAQRTGCAILGISHLNKNVAAPAWARVMGSVAFTAASRFTLLIAKDPADENRRLMIPHKCNIVEKPSGLAFRIIDGAVQWSREPITMDADTLLATDGRDKHNERDEAANWLRDFLSEGPRSSAEVKDAAVNGEGLVWGTVIRAKKSAGVRSEKSGMKDGWIWSLMQGGGATKKCAPSVNDANLRGIDCAPSANGVKNRTCAGPPRRFAPSVEDAHVSVGGVDDSDRLEREAIQSVEREQEDLARRNGRRVAQCGLCAPVEAPRQC